MSDEEYLIQWTKIILMFLFGSWFTIWSILMLLK